MNLVSSICNSFRGHIGKNTGGGVVEVDFHGQPVRYTETSDYCMNEHLNATGSQMNASFSQDLYLNNFKTNSILLNSKL